MKLLRFLYIPVVLCISMAMSGRLPMTNMPPNKRSTDTSSLYSALAGGTVTGSNAWKIDNSYGTVTVDQNDIRTGGYSLVFQCHPGDSAGSTGYEKSEVLGLLDSKGYEVLDTAGTKYYGFSVKFNKDWVTTGKTNILQWTYRDSLNNPFPAVAIAATDTGLALTVRGGNLTDTSILPIHTIGLSNDSLNLGHWIDMIIKVTWADLGQVVVYRKDSSTGTFANVAELDNVQTILYRGIDLTHPVKLQARAGIFRHAQSSVSRLKIGAFVRSSTYAKCDSVLSIRDTVKVLYGFNALMNYSARPLSDPYVADTTLAFGPPYIVRYPGGGPSESFNWHTGKLDDGSGNPFTLGDLRILRLKTGCDFAFILDMMHTMADQIAMLDSARSLGIPIKFIEMGNEYNNANNAGHLYFGGSNGKAAYNYRDTCKVWMAALRARYLGVKIAMTGGNRTGTPDGKIWNSIVVQANPDALICHIYPEPPDYIINDTINYVRLRSEIVDTAWLSRGFDKVNLPVWITEFGTNYAGKDGIPYVISDTNKQLTLIYEMQTIPTIGRITMMLMQGMEGPSSGAMIVLNGSIQVTPRGRTMRDWIHVH